MVAASRRCTDRDVDSEKETELTYNVRINCQVQGPTAPSDRVGADTRLPPQTCK